MHQIKPIYKKITIVACYCSSLTIHAELNDTGITFCSDASQNNLRCPVTGFSGQDAEYGINGFSFTKLDAAGVEMPATATNHSCVRDNVTGLMWEVKTDDGGAHDQDWTFTWNYTERYAQYINELGLCGFRDWRVPAVKELTGIIDYGVYYGTPIVAAYFPNTKGGWYWSSTLASYGSGSAWAVVFHHGLVSDNAKSKRYFVRLVRGEPSTGNFVDNGTSTVTDNATGLMWSKCSEGLEGENCEIGRLKPLNWDEALDTARNSRLAGYNDWRLPNVKELQSLVKYDVYAPSIDTTNFPNTSSRLYWSSTPFAYAASKPSYSWPVNFHYGYVYVEDDDRTDQRAVRLVRDVQGAYSGQIVKHSKSLIVLPPAATNANHEWNFVNAPTGFANVVVMAGPPSYNEIDPGVVRLRNINDQGFEASFQEWEYRAEDFLDLAHTVEKIPYLMLTRGRQQFSDGSTWEVGTAPVTRAGVWQKIPFVGVFNHPPHLFLTVQSVNDQRAVTARARNISNGEFEVALFEQEAFMDGHSIETVGYLAIDNPNLSNMQAVRKIQAPYPYLLQNFYADQRWVPVLSQRIKVEEERSDDDEITHPEELIHALAFGNQLFAQQVSNNDADTTALRQMLPINNVPMEWGMIRGITHGWNLLPFSKTYQQPVLVISPVSMLSEPGTIRMRNLSSNYTAISYREWDYLDGIHDVAESAFYMLVEAGEYVLGNPDQSLMIEAKRLDTAKLARANEWNNIAFAAEFINPAIFAAVLTNNSSDDINRINNTVITRITERNNIGFKLAMDEQELQTDGHTSETLGWIAIETDTILNLDGRKLSAFFGEANSMLDVVTYPFITEHHFPTVLGQVTSANELDPITLQYVDPINDSILLRLEEEQSSDEELEHVIEEIGIFVAE